MSKVSLKLIQGSSYYIVGVFAVGVYRYGNKVILIDSGSDEQSARDVADALAAENYTVSAIINTHCHPDHCGGNYFFQKKYPEVKIYAAYDEKMFIEDPKWAPRCFCGNAAPFSGLKNKHIAPLKSSIVTMTIPYLLGIGDIASLEATIPLGLDTFDSSHPTKCARHGMLFTFNGFVKINNSRYQNLFEPIEKGCLCYTCKNYTIAYLRHLFKAYELTAYTLASIHNITFMMEYMRRKRAAILNDEI